MLRNASKFILICCFSISSQVYAGQVARGQFTSAVLEREPVDRVEVLESQQNQIVYFTELKDLQDQQITHQWVYDDEIIFEKSFTVKGPHWRVWSSKTLQPGWTGLWYVNTMDGEGIKLLTQSFEYRK
jgi:hypothetical protein